MLVEAEARVVLSVSVVVPGYEYGRRGSVLLKTALSSLSKRGYKHAVAMTRVGSRRHGRASPQTNNDLVRGG
mgnify:CR=1 FL=1